MSRIIVILLTPFIATIAMHSCTNDEGETAELQPQKQFYRIYSLSAPESFYAQRTKEDPLSIRLEFGDIFPHYFDFGEKYVGVLGNSSISRWQLTGEAKARFDSICSLHYNDGEPFVEGQDTVARANLVYRLQNIKVTTYDRITRELTDRSADFTISFVSYARYMTEKPKTMGDNKDKYIYRISKPLTEMTAEDYQWLDRGWAQDNGIYLTTDIEEYQFTSLSIRVEGNDTIISRSVR